jgi:WxcM-like protein
MIPPSFSLDEAPAGAVRTPSRPASIGALEELQIDPALAAYGCELLQFPKIADPRGNLTFVECHKHVDFQIERVFYLYDVPGGSQRGGHALKHTSQVLVAMSGSFDVVLTDGYSTQRVHLNRSYFGLHVPPRIWREMDNFSSNSICMVLASRGYDEEDYYREWDDYLKATPGAAH